MHGRPQCSVNERKKEVILRSLALSPLAYRVIKVRVWKGKGLQMSLWVFRKVALMRHESVLWELFWFLIWWVRMSQYVLI